MKYLIINGDDFGASRGINRGIIEACQCGVLTSTSLMVNGRSAEEAVALGRSVPKLSLGLHFDLGRDSGTHLADSRARLHTELREQMRRFRELTGQLPSHLDSHHNVHLDLRLLPEFMELAREYDLPLRGQPPIRQFSKFYGQWRGQTHLEQVSVAALTRMLETEIEEGVTELSCHPGYVSPKDPTGYTLEREAELRTLCDPAIRHVLEEQSIQLISYHAAANLRATAAL
jgi:predicted glycoside hydrolase/deacetylase ChbG (UPF0249 family)